MALGNKKRVALALSSGGPRGFAYIGALEVLEERGYEVTAIAGTSIGALVGGIYAAGRLAEFKKWLLTLNSWKLFSLMDLSLSMNHVVKGDKLMDAIQKVVPDAQIEELNLPFSAIATDLYSGEEVIFDKGDLFLAIRASMSIPSLFRPVQVGETILVDGHSSNCLPLNRVKRTEGDILIGFDVNHFDIEAIRQNIAATRKTLAEYETLVAKKEAEVKALSTTIKMNKVTSIWQKLRALGQLRSEAKREMRDFHETYVEPLPDIDYRSEERL
jgi:NTE family protein